MANHPTHPSPYLSSIDADSVGGNVFRCQVRDLVYGYVFTIKDATNGTEVYTAENLKFYNDTVEFIKNYLKENIGRYSTIGSVRKEVVEECDSMLEDYSPKPICENGILEIEVPKQTLLNGKDYVWNILLYSSSTPITFYGVESHIADYDGAAIDNGKNDILVKREIYPSVSVGKYAFVYDIDFTRQISESDYYAQLYRHRLRRVTGKYNSCSNPNYDNYKTIAEIVNGNISNNDIAPDDSDESFTSIVNGLSKVQSADYYFSTKNGAVITFDVPEKFTSTLMSVSASYIQMQDVVPVYHCFNLYLKDELVDTTGNIFSSNIKYEYNGLVSGGKYTLELIIVDTDKNKHTLERDFHVEYTNYPTFVLPEVSVNSKDGCIDVDYSNNIVIEGNVDGDPDTLFRKFVNSSEETTPENTNGICLSRNQDIYWDTKTGDIPLELDNTCQIIHWHGHEGFYGTIFEKIDAQNYANNVTVRYDGRAFYYKIGLNDEVERCPYSNTASAIFPADIFPTDKIIVIDEDTIYEINDGDEINDTDSLVSNDLAYKYWWFIVILKNEVRFIKSKSYDGTVVN